MVSSHVYEIIKTIYNTPASESTDAARISVLQNTLIQLRLANIATLDALMTHFTRLIELTSADEAYITALAQALAPCILRPRLENSLTMDEKHAYRLIRDLFAHKTQIFSELKRASSLSHSQSVTDTRPRAVSSTDESGRKAAMETRQRAIIAASSHSATQERPSRSRATSPNPSARGHRRDRSSGGPETRFPVATSSSPTASRGSKTSSGVDRNSLEVPSTDGASATEKEDEKPSATVLGPATNGAGEFGAPLTTVPDGMEDITLSKRDSLGRSGHATKNSLARKQLGTGGLNRQSLVSVSGGNNENSGSEMSDSSRVGVSLTDKPMDD